MNDDFDLTIAWPSLDKFFLGSAHTPTEYIADEGANDGQRVAYV